MGTQHIAANAGATDRRVLSSAEAKALAVAVLEGEQMLLAGAGGQLHLSDVRVRFDKKMSGYSDYVSIMLESVSSCRVSSRSSPLLLFIAMLLTLAWLAKYLLPVGTPDFLLVVAVVFAITYLGTRRSVLKISSNGGEAIVVGARNMSRSDMHRFAEAVDAQRLHKSTRSG